MAAYNRYRGSGSRPERMEEPARQNKKPPQPKPPMRKNPPPKLSGGTLAGYIPQKLGELETEDFLLILILYLMYRESGDKDLLIIMGAMYLL